MQAFSPHFMRVFLLGLWKSGINGGDLTPRTTMTRQMAPIRRCVIACTTSRLFPPVKAQHGVALPQLALPPQRAEFIAGIEVLIMLGNHQPCGV